MMKHLKELCLLRGVSSFEEEVRSYIEKAAAPYAASMRTDRLGNLIVGKKGRKRGAKRLMLSAHMDEVGFIVTKIEKEGFLRVGRVGGIDPRVMLGRRVVIGEKAVPGIIGLRPVHLLTEEEEKAVPKASSLYVDIGMPDKDAALKVASLGDEVSFYSDFARFGDGMIKCKAIDDRFGCAVMLNLIEKELPVDVTFVFTVQEEVGMRGAFGAAFSVKPDIALILEGSTCADIPSVKGASKVTRIGGGPVIGCRDRGTVYDPELFEMIRDTAEKAGLPWQIKSLIAGGTDAASVQRSRGGVRVASISAPVRYLHAASTAASLEDIDNAFKLTELVIERIADGRI